jgi:hypothetical protein
MSDRPPNRSATPSSDCSEPKAKAAAEQAALLENSRARTENPILCNFPGLRELVESGEG